MSTPGIRRLTQSSRNQLRALLEAAFTLEELQLLCADLGVDHENLGGGMKSVRVLNLVTMMERHNRAADLVARCAELRPAIAWQAEFEVNEVAPVAPAAGVEAPTQRQPVFINGLPTKAPDRPAHPMVRVVGAGLDIAPFEIDVYPVTNADYLLYLEKNSAAATPAGWVQRRPAAGTDNHPVVGVTFAMAEAYARWTGKRLPTAKEWLAAAGCEANAYPWGGAFDAMRANCESVRKGTTAVDAYPDGASAHGVFDLAGNVWEWTLDEVAARGLSKGKTKRVLKGGSWRSPRQQLTCGAELTLWPDVSQDDVGFRCVR